VTNSEDEMINSDHGRIYSIAKEENPHVNRKGKNQEEKTKCEEKEKKETCVDV
jgi:hypothetical protein